MDNVVVNLFGNDVTLDKTIYVSLDNDVTLFGMFPDAAKDLCFAGSYNDLCEMIKQKRPSITTPITKCVDSHIMELGYDIVVQSKNKYIRFSDLLNGDTRKSFGKEIRAAHNWEKLLYNEGFNLDIPDWR